MKILINPDHIRLDTCSSLVLGANRGALSNGMLRFSIASTMIFGIIDGTMENVKIIIWTIENLNISLDRARRVVLGT